MAIDGIVVDVPDGAEFDAVKTSERTLVDRMTFQFAPGMIVLADRGFYSYDLWNAATEDGA